MALKDIAETGSFWFPYGRTAIGTYKQVATGSLTCHYEKTPTQLGLATTADTDIDIPKDWEQALLDFVAWRIFERVDKLDRKRAAYHRDQYLHWVKRAAPRAERFVGLRANPRITDY
jgi:hypothetical protein